MSDPIHNFDADGKSVLLRRALERENAILKARVESLMLIVRHLTTKLDTDELSQPVRH